MLLLNMLANNPHTLKGFTWMKIRLFFEILRRFTGKGLHPFGPN